MWTCRHKKKHFIALTVTNGILEKHYSCQSCGMIISEVAVDHIFEIKNQGKEVIA